jgi:hypothetical protein
MKMPVCSSYLTGHQHVAALERNKRFVRGEIARRDFPAQFCSR